MNNYQGVVIQPLSPQDFVAGANSPIVLEQRNTTYNWLQFFAEGERQSFPWGDSMSCVSFSLVHHLIAPQLNWMLANNLFSTKALEFFNKHGYIVNGKFNLSERFIAVLSGTTEQGNSWQNVAEAARKCGVVPEALCPANTPTSRAEWFTVSDEAKAVGLESLQYLKFLWQGINKSQIQSYLVQSPCEVFTAVCEGWESDNPIKACNQPIQHATGVYAIRGDGAYCDFDQYVPFLKYLAPDYEMPYVFQMIVNLIPQQQDHIDRHLFLRDMVQNERSQEVLFLQAKLAIPTTGVYDQATVPAVHKFMVANKIGSWWERNVWPAGYRVGPKIRAVLNQ